MERRHLLQLLTRYRDTWAAGRLPYEGFSETRESHEVQRFVDFIEKNNSCFSRSNITGHITGSALVTDSKLERVLLTHHRRLGIWVQLGGHSDDDPITENVAMREAHEESGLKDLSFMPYEARFAQTILRSTDIARQRQFVRQDPPLPFDIDAHEIPANKNKKEEAHLHFDIRFLIIASGNTIPVISEESIDLRWFTLEEAQKLTQETSMLRQFSKLKFLSKV